MGQKHSERDFVLLVLERAVLTQDLDGFELVEYILKVIAIIKFQDTLLYKLHASKASEHLGA